MPSDPPRGTTLHLVRHATHDRVGRVLCGRMTGVSLNEAGRRQAEALAGHFAGPGLAAVQTSPAGRCTETAEPIARRAGLPLVIAPALDEIDFGDWTGLGFDGLQADPRWAAWNGDRDTGAAPNGETMRAAQARALHHLQQLLVRHPGQAVAAISHADIIKAILCHYLAAPLQSYARFDVDPASISTLALWPGGGRVLRLNQALPA